MRNAGRLEKRGCRERGSRVEFTRTATARWPPPPARPSNRSTGKFSRRARGERREEHSRHGGCGGGQIRGASHVGDQKVGVSEMGLAGERRWHDESENHSAQKKWKKAPTEFHCRGVPVLCRVPSSLNNGCLLTLPKNINSKSETHLLLHNIHKEARPCITEP